MEASGVQEENRRLEYLEIELQQQRGMMWLFGEIMKEAVNISSFKQLMSIITDMLMGVMGVTTCYLWIAKSEADEKDYKVYYRSVEQDNYFNVMTMPKIPARLDDVKETYTFKKEEITSSLMEGINTPCSRLAVPLKDFNNDMNFGMLVLEHEEEDFFTENTVAFFQTLAIYIAINAQNSRLLQTISHQSLTDPLTGIYNRRHLNEILEQIYNTYKILTIGVIDTDNFKFINDEYGHFTGDNVLKAIAQIGKCTVKEYGGEIIRYGGDEFIIIIPLPLEDSIEVLEEFRNSVYYIQATHEIDMIVTVTIGVCSTSNIEVTPYEAIKIADQALLRGKAMGKNRITLAINEDMNYNNKTSKTAEGVT